MNLIVLEQVSRTKVDFPGVGSLRDALDSKAVE